MALLFPLFPQAHAFAHQNWRERERKRIRGQVALILKKKARETKSSLFDSSTTTRGRLARRNLKRDKKIWKERGRRGGCLFEVQLSSPFYEGVCGIKTETLTRPLRRYSHTVPRLAATGTDSELLVPLAARASPAPRGGPGLHAVTWTVTGTVSVTGSRRACDTHLRVILIVIVILVVRRHRDRDKSS